MNINWPLEIFSEVIGWCCLLLQGSTSCFQCVSTLLDAIIDIGLIYDQPTFLSAVLRESKYQANKSC